MAQMGEFLLMGPRGSGKTTIVKRLQTWSEDKRLSPFDQIPATRPTEGIQQTSFKARQLSILLKELGGASIREWASHAGSVVGIIFVFDGADFILTATNAVWLNEVLNDSDCEQKPVLVLLSKCDIPGCIRFKIIDEIIGFDRVLNPSRITFMETSSVVGIGFSEAFRWLQEAVKGNATAQP
jgi:GTPase SAR1 family protein